MVVWNCALQHRAVVLVPGFILRPQPKSVWRDAGGSLPGLVRGWRLPSRDARRDATYSDGVRGIAFVQPLCNFESDLEIGIGAASVLFVDFADVRTARDADASSED
jgi:hypothetical protein